MTFYKDTYGNIYGDTHVTPVGRLQYLSIATPAKFKNKESYQAVLLFEKANQDKWMAGFSLIESNVNDMLAQEYPDGDYPAMSYPMLRDGDEHPERSGHAGAFYIKASAGANKRPAVFDINERPLDPGVIQAGMWGRLVVRVKLFDRGVAYELVGVQLVKDDGFRFTKGPSPLAFLTATPLTGLPEGTQVAVAQVAEQEAASEAAAAPVAAPVASPVAKPVAPKAAPAAVARPASPAAATVAAQVAPSAARPAPVAAAKPAGAKPVAAAAPSIGKPVAAAAKPAAAPAAGQARGLAGVARLNNQI